MKNYEKQTQEYSTFGDKLLQHLDVLSDIQNKGKWKPITVQLCPTSVCDLNCIFCSVKNRNKILSLRLDWIKKGLKDFKDLGAKALEITGGGNPLLYPKINEVIRYALGLGYEIGIISNSARPAKFLSKENLGFITWYRASLNGLDAGIDDFDFDAIPKGRLGFSYIINEKTTEEILRKIVDLVNKYPDIKFVRIAPNCLEGSKIRDFKKDWGDLIDKVDSTGKFFIKEINENFKPYADYCGVGLLRPYIVEDGYVYICSSHVLSQRKCDEKYRLGHITDVNKIYREANKNHKKFGAPYAINPKECLYCFYHNNNKILHSIVKNMPDKNFT